MTTVVVAVDAADGVTLQKATVTAGTPVQLTTNTRKLSSGVKIRAKTGNTGFIYVGFSNAVSSSNGYQLAAGEESGFIAVRTADGIWINSSVDAEGVCAMLI